jgi:hypothetical protein
MKAVERMYRAIENMFINGPPPIWMPHAPQEALYKVQDTLVKVIGAESNKLIKLADSTINLKLKKVENALNAENKLNAENMTGGAIMFTEEDCVF